jgi:hypothetical protein
VRFVVGLLAYLVGVSVVVGIGIVGLGALQSPGDRTSTASIASKSERVVSPAKPTLPAQSKTSPDKKNKTARVTHKRIHPGPNTVGGGEAYGYAAEPRHRIDPNFFFFGR